MYRVSFKIKLLARQGYPELLHCAAASKLAFVGSAYTMLSVDIHQCEVHRLRDGLCQNYHTALGLSFAAADAGSDTNVLSMH